MSGKNYRLLGLWRVDFCISYKRKAGIFKAIGLVYNFTYILEAAFSPYLTRQKACRTGKLFCDEFLLSELCHRRNFTPDLQNKHSGAWKSPA